MIYMINCSYKGRTSNSRYFLSLLEKEIRKYSELNENENKINKIKTMLREKL